MPRKLNIGVVGLGRIGWDYHCPTLFKHKRFNLTCVCDSDNLRLGESQKIYETKGYTDLREMLKIEKLDVLTIATPTHFHQTMAIQAFKEGVHVFLEKPLAMNPTEARSIIRSAKKYNCLFSVFQPARITGYYNQIKDILSKGKIGKPYHFRRTLDNFVQRNDWQALQEFGGGMLNNYGAHAIDQLFDLTGSNIKRFFADRKLVLSCGDADDVVRILYETKEGLIGDIDVNQAYAGKRNDFEITGTRGIINLIDDNTILLKNIKGKLPLKKIDPKLSSEGRKYPSDNIAFEEKIIKVNHAKYSIDIYKNFADAIQKGSPLCVPPEQTLEVMSMLKKCAQQSPILHLK